MEVKNATNTDNSSSRTAKLSLLAAHKRDHPDFTAVYGCIFDHRKRDGSSDKWICHNGQWIRVLTGHALFRFLFGDEADVVRETVEHAVRAYKIKN
ncbi:hypothetical protein EBZ80_10390 [bacterium]|nr:hypothetical protein [bacterium]